MEKETTDGSLVYPEPNKRATFRQLRLKAMNMVVLPGVSWFKTVRLLGNILMATSKPSRNGGFARIPQMPSNTLTMEKIFVVH